MPQPGKRWRHIILNTHSSWLPADKRGFRSRSHRIHSSGDYKRPPPSNEHSGLRKYQIAQSSEMVRLHKDLWPIIGMAIVQNLIKHEHQTAAISVDSVHIHALVELPDNVPLIKKTMGWCKYFATRAARSTCPEMKDVEIWSEGESYGPVDSATHFNSLVPYILEKQAGAWTWSSGNAVRW